MTKRLLEAAELDSLIGDRSSRIGIKPNLVVPAPAEFGATTHPEVVAGVIEYLLAGGSAVILKPFGSESKLNVYISIAGDTEQDAEAMKERICEDLENIIYMDGRMGYCCE